LPERFEKYARDFLAGMERKDEYAHAVAKIILARLDDETLPIEKVAKEMSVRVRTSQNPWKPRVSFSATCFAMSASSWPGNTCAGTIRWSKSATC
jgi:hypothetical protein